MGKTDEEKKNDWHRVNSERFAAVVLMSATLVDTVDRKLIAFRRFYLIVLLHPRRRSRRRHN